MSNPRYGSGRKQFVGQGIEADLGKLDPAAYPGAVAYSDGELYYSDGSEWIVPQDEVDIARPRNLSPTNATEQSQLRLSAFRSPTGETQTGIIFEANTDGLPNFGEGANLITRNITSEIASLYQLIYPDDGFQPGETIWWRARYLGTNGTQSQFSIPTAQVFPDLITTPSPVTPAFAITGTVTATAYDSPSIFALSYYDTVTEFYAANAVPGVDTPAATVTHTNGAVTTIPSTLSAGVAYYWRTRYGGRVTVGSPVVTSAWSVTRGVVPGGQSMILEYNLTLASARTIGIPLAGTVNVSVNWGDGVTETFTTAGVKTHTYASGFGPTVLVTITGTLTAFGTNSISAAQQQGLTRVENWGFGLGLTSLAYALARTSNLTYVSPTLPATVTSLQGFLSNSTGNPDVAALDVSNVTNMNAIFNGSPTFNRAIGGWDTSKVTNMALAFAYATAFNQPIGTWNTANVTTMSEMFRNSIVFNQNIGAWNVAKVTTMSYMFNVASAFNNGGSPTINNWNTGAVTDMFNMFSNASVFNQPIGNWNVSNVTTMTSMFYGAAAFNQNIGAWNVSKVTITVQMFAYSSFNNGGSPSINNWNPIALKNAGSMFSLAPFNQPIGGWNTSSITDMNNMFSSNPVFNQPIGTWNTSAVTNMGAMFQSVIAFNQDISAWNTSSVTAMNSMFQQAHYFNQNVGTWNVGNVTNMSNMFYLGYAFNNGGSPSIANWDTSKVTNAAGIFQGCSVFNQPIGNWNLSSSTTISGTLFQTGAFNQDIGGWDLRPAGTSLAELGLPGVNQENYSRTLIGWANYVATNDGPYTVPLSVTATRQYNANNYVTGARFTNAVAARAFLVGGRAVSVTGSSDTNANTTYTYNGTTQTYDASNGWKFAVLGTSWALYNGSAVLQATGTGTVVGSGPHTATSWTGVLSAATVLRTGAAWTITGDAAA